MAVQDEPFDINLTGETSGELWHGTFRAKPALSHRDVLIADAKRRELLGTQNGNAPSPRAASIAEVIGELTARLTLTPKWFLEANYGLDLVDDNVLTEVYQKTMEVELKARKAKAEKSEADRAELAKEAEKK